MMITMNKGKPNKTNFAHVLIGNFEIYPDPEPYLAPDEIWGLVETDFLLEIANNTEKN